MTANLNLQQDWTSLAGKSVEIRMRNAVIRRGIVETVTPDGSVLWISPYGADSREMVERAGGYQVWSQH